LLFEEDFFEEGIEEVGFVLEGEGFLGI